jgi:O-antigen/teichoic acid export membrane protein
MSQIRKQSLISSMVVYIGFGLGLLNTYLFTRQGGFTREEYGLTNIFIGIATLMFYFSNLGMGPYIGKFYPYYNDNLPRKKNDLMSWATLISMIGFGLVIILGILFKDLVIRKFGGNSPYLVKYYHWIFLFGLGLSIYSLFEAYAWQLRKSVFTNYLREVQFRMFTTILILLTITGVIANFDVFIKIYSGTYFLLALILIIYLTATHQLYFTFRISIVTKKFFKKIITLISFIYGGSLVYMVASVFDTIVIAAVMKDGLAYAGVFALAQNIASLIQAPQRGIISSSVAALSQAWKDKNMAKISRIYHRSSINQLVFAIGLFALIWLNFSDGIFTFKLQHEYLDARWVFFFIGLMRIIDMGTGVNSQIIATSTQWRFEFFTGIILLCITLPFNYILTKRMGVLGPAISNLITFTIYNFIRYVFLLRKYQLQPFDAKSLYIILIGIGCFLIIYYPFINLHGFAGLFARSICFLALYITGTIVLKISPDIIPIWHTIIKRTGIKKKD